MNSICETCDTRLRLEKCSGRDGDFKYCFRPAGSTENINYDTIIPFDDIHDIISQIRSDGWVDKSSIYMKRYFGDHLMVMMGKEKSSGYELPIGFVVC